MGNKRRFVAAILTTGLLQRPSGETEAQRDAEKAVELYRRVLRALKKRKKARL